MEERVTVTIQADKLNRICDVIFSNTPIAPVSTGTTKEEREFFKKEKAAYDWKMNRLKEMRQTVLNSYRGRQIDDVEIMEHLRSLLFSLINQ